MHMSSKLKELRKKKQELMSSVVVDIEKQRKRRRAIERGVDDVLNFKGLRNLKRRGRISTSQSHWNNEFRKSKFN